MSPSQLVMVHKLLLVSNLKHALRVYIFWTDIYQALLSKFSLLEESFIEKVHSAVKN